MLEQAERWGADGRHRDGAKVAEAVLARPDATSGQQAHAREALSLHRLRLGDFEASVHQGLLAMEYFVASDDLLRQSKLHCTLALAYHETALNEQALRHVLAALEAARACGSRTAEFWALSRSAMVHEAMGDPTRGMQLSRQALDLARTLDDPEAGFAALNNLGDTCIEVARGQKALGLDASIALQEGLIHVRGAVDAAQVLGHTFYESMALSNLVSILIELEEYPEAREQAYRAKEMARANGYRNLEVNNDAQIAAIVRAQGNLDEATAMMDAQLADPSAEEDLMLLTTLHRALFEMHKSSGRFEQALNHYEQLHELTFRMAQQTAGLQSKMLINTIEIEQARHDAERATLEAQMQRLRAEELDTAARTDPLTRLPNRRALDMELPLMLERAERDSQPLCAAMIDFDHFKQVNDVYGHGVGDEVLIAMASMLRSVTREADLAVRMGGEEFLLVLTDTSRERAGQACERLLASVRDFTWASIGPGLSCTVSAGVAQWDGVERSSHWLARADAALYAAKHGGRDRVSIDPT
ncbi:GGDEF domain-containing protein [Cryobacterium sp. MLB-32]|uniref:tetratricopeptide repeat-containing diguanylate cyclase n=1 Tax=Cryobacterium sp. MLB-32 TaxID=1529318 RepID=UPI0018CFD2B5|nr:GGDEF domain-containing protein [Cryobacterium sp. MLB-32]